MKYKQGRYSNFIKPLFIMMDLIILNFTIFWFEINLTNAYLFCLYISLSWLLISIKNHFYEVQRHTRIIQIIPLLLRQFSVFAITLYAFIGFFKQPGISRLALVNYLLLVLLLILVFKLQSRSLILLISSTQRPGRTDFPFRI